MRRQAALGGHVYNQHGLASELAAVKRLAVQAWKVGPIDDFASRQCLRHREGVSGVGLDRCADRSWPQTPTASPRW